MTDISSLKRWTLAMFPLIDWEDKNKDGRVQKSELFLGGRPSIGEAKEKLETVQTAYIPLIEQIDKDGDGISMGEVKAFTSPPEKYDLAFIWDEIKEALSAKGVFEMPSAPVVFVTEETIPKELNELQGAKEFIKVIKEEGRPQTWMLGKKDGKFTAFTDSGKEKVCIILVPKAFLGDDMPNSIIAGTFLHELAHARQYLSGVIRESMAINTLLARAGALDKDAYVAAKSLEMNINEVWPIKQQLLMAIRLKDPNLVLIYCMRMNRVLAALNYALKKLDKAGHKEAAKAVREILGRDFSKKENISVNREMAKIAAEITLEAQKFKVQRDVLPDKYVEIYKVELRDEEKTLADILDVDPG